MRFFLQNCTCSYFTR